MNSKQLSIFKILLFIGGFIIIGIAFTIINYPVSESELTDSQNFLWIEICLCYIVFFVPFFFSSITSKTINTKITSTVNIWISVIFFEIAAISFTILALSKIVTIRAAVLVELIVFFLGAILVYFGYFAGNHIGNVQAQEAKSLSKIAELKSAFEMLSVKTDMWDYELSNQKETIRKLCDDVRYMSPVDTELASQLEMKLIISAKVLTESNLAPSEMDIKIAELTNLINQRKLLKK